MTIASLVRFDMFILLPNSLGALSGSIQLVCHGLYGNYCGRKPKPEPTVESAKARVEDESDQKADAVLEEPPKESSDIVLV